MQTFLNIGVDVAKDEVVVACAAQSFDETTSHSTKRANNARQVAGYPVRSIPNQRAPLLAWLKSLPAGSRIGLEATGGYHELLADLAHAQGFTVFVLNPRDTRHYARAMGNRTKTDRVDAELIARLVAQEYARLRPYTPPSADQRRLDRLLKRRAKLTSIKGALKLTMKNLSGFTAELEAVLLKLDALIARIDAATTEIAARSPQHVEAQQRVQTIVGVGSVVGVALTTTLERIPFRSADALVAFIGYDLVANDSGHKIGRDRKSTRLNSSHQ